MNAIPWAYANNFSSVKAAKETFVGDYVNNHPHRLSSIRLTGSYNFEFDGRVVAGEALTAPKINVDVDYALLPAWTRVYGDLPVISPIGQVGGPEPTLNIGVNKFYVAQNLNYFWRFYLVAGSLSEPVKVGETKTALWARDSEESEWFEAYTETEDIMESGYPFVSVSFDSGIGGDPVSGGRGPDNAENSVDIGFALPSSGFPISTGYERPIYRLPWQDPWANESGVFAQNMQDFVDGNNDYQGGGCTGSSSVTLEFT